MGVTPRNSFSRETRTQDKADGQLQKRIFVNSLCAHSGGTHITSLKSCPKCEPSLSLHLLQALQPSSNLVQTLLRPQRRMPALETGAALLFARVSPGGGLLLDLSLGVLDVQAMFLESMPGCHTSPSG